MSKIKGSKRFGRDIKAAVGSYLRRRHYIGSSDSYRTSELVTEQSREQMAVRAAIEKDASRLNSITFGNINADPQLVEQQIIQFWSWMSNSLDDSTRMEIRATLLPLYIHLYIDLLRYGNRLSLSTTIVEEFLNYEYSEEARQLVDSLHQIRSIQDVEHYGLLRAFRSSKVHVRMSSNSCARLRSYLQNTTNVMLLQALQQWFELDIVVDSSSLQEDDGASNAYSNDYDRMMATAGPSTSSGSGSAGPSTSASTPTWHHPQEERDLRQLQEAIRTVRESPPLPPPVLCYGIFNAEQIICARISRKYRTVAAGSQTNELRLFSTQETKLPNRGAPPGASSHGSASSSSSGLHITPVYHYQERHSVLRGHMGPVNDVAFVEEAEVLLSVSHDQDMRAWRLSDQMCISLYRGHTLPIWGVNVAPFALHMATCSQDRSVRIWNLDRTYPLRILGGHTEDVNCARFHCNGRYVASGSHDKSVRMWDVYGSDMVRVFHGHSGSVQAVQFSPNGNYIASGGDNGRVKIFDIKMGRQIAELKGHASRIVAVDWSRDGSTLTTGSRDGLVMLWRINNLAPTDGQSSRSSDVIVFDRPDILYTQFQSLFNVQFSTRNTCNAIGSLKTPEKDKNKQKDRE